MAVLSLREVLPRTVSHKFGEAPSAEIKYVLTVDAPTPTQDCIGAVGIAHGAAHPEFDYLRMLDATVTETDRHHVEISYRFSVSKQEDAEPNPLARPDVWSFSTGGAQVPALTYYHGAGNADIRPLQNTAGEYIEGLTTLEAEVRATIAGNREQFPLATAAAVTNCVNSSPYLGGAAYTWQCGGISGSQETEVVDGEEVRYWKITVELIYRRSTWNLLVPNVGWNFLEAGVLKRAWVKDPDDPNLKIASGAPRALEANGAMKADGQAPDILGGGSGLRVFPAVEFQPYFGTPPF
jgi:hypothetical protein